MATVNNEFEDLEDNDDDLNNRTRTMSQDEEELDDDKDAPPPDRAGDNISRRGFRSILSRYERSHPTPNVARTDRLRMPVLIQAALQSLPTSTDPRHPRVVQTNCRLRS